MKHIALHFFKILLCDLFPLCVSNFRNAINLQKSLSHLILNPLKALIVGNKVSDKDCRFSKETKLLCSYP